MLQIHGRGKRGWTIVMLLAAIGSSPVRADDWPMWHANPQRSRATAESLAEELVLAWQRDLLPNHVAWQEDSRIQFDRVLQPIVTGHRLIVGSSTDDSVRAFDTRTGTQVWQFYAGGPVRLAPVAWQGRVYFGADDGLLYCLSAKSGELHWKFQAAPGPRRILGNDRLISVWPLRGGPVVGAGKLHFTAGIWPFEGTLWYSLDLARSQTAPSYEVTSLDDVSPQGHLVFNGGRVYLPGGRAKATCLDASTGATLGLAYDSRGLTDYHVATAGPLLFHGNTVYDTEHQRMLPIKLVRPVSDGRYIFGTTNAGEQGTTLVAYDLKLRETIVETDRRGAKVEKDRLTPVWQIAVQELTGSKEPFTLHLKANDELVGSQTDRIYRLKFASWDQPPSIGWSGKLAGPAATAIAADEKLFVIDQQARLSCFTNQSQAPERPAQLGLPQSDIAAASPEWVRQAKTLVDSAQDPAGYCVVWNGRRELVEQLVANSQMRVLLVSSKPDEIPELRRYFGERQLDGRRVAVLEASPDALRLPAYLASLLVVPEASANELDDGAFRQQLYAVLRPYGGTMAIQVGGPAAAEQLKERLAADNLEGAVIESAQGLVRVSRQGALKGAADWTHEYGDAANSLMSLDQRVKAPLGVLWFGGPAGSGELYYNRHYWAPGPTVVQGRMIVQGPKRLAAIDIYTGRILWKRELPEGSGPGRRGNFFEVKKPGFHFTAAADAVYLVFPDVCLRLDPATGKTVEEFHLPKKQQLWGKVRIWRDQLVAVTFTRDAKGKESPTGLVAVDRMSGELRWQREAKYGVPLVAVGGDKIYYFDASLTGFYDAWRRRGKVPEAADFRYLMALDAKTGKPVWERTVGRVVTWLAYSPEHDVLVASNKEGLDAVRGKDGEELWSQQVEAPGFGGHPENVWDKVILSGRQVIDQRGPGRAFNLLTGELELDLNPLTGEEVPWQFTKTGHHCNYAIASPHLLTFRAASAGFFDRTTNGTARLNGFRSGCRNSLIPAGGVLNAPNYAHGCVCSYNLFTSLGLIHSPQTEMWTYNAFDSPDRAPRKFGINLGAPGDRVAEDGTMWMEFPRQRDPSAAMTVDAAGEAISWFRRHPQQVTAVVEGNPAWVGASGGEGLAQLRVVIPGKPSSTRRYQVRLYFAEPARDTLVGQRVFDVWLQGKRVLRELDVLAEAGQAGRMIEKTFEGIATESELRLELRPKQGKPILSGVKCTLQSDAPATDTRR